MRRLETIRAAAVAIMIGALTIGTLACTRPSEGDCKKAITNIRRLHGNDSSDTSGFLAAVRSCQGSATKKSVKCFIDAQDLVSLKECEGDLYEKMFGKDEPVTPAPEPTPAPTAPAPAAPAPAAPATPAAPDAPAAPEATAPAPEATAPAPKAADPAPAPKAADPATP